MNETFYVTTPIYYVNDKPHIGHSYTTIAADVLARFNRRQGKRVHFLTGTDEHGIKIFKAAEEKGATPRALADEVVVHFQDLWKDLNISNDDFIRTTQPRHEARVQELIRRLLAKDEIYEGKYEGWYDEGQEEFVTESTARENEYKSAINGKPLVRYSESAWFFRLAKHVPDLKAKIESGEFRILPDSRRNEVLSKLEMGVEDLCISRGIDKLPWGVPMPNDPKHVVYVWIDALSNYYTALGLPEIGDEFDGKFKDFWPCDLHLIGKDILWFHAVYWPCMLLAMDIALPKCVFAHGWWMSEGKKMSKSLGNFISREVITEICQSYSLDVYRYYLLRAVPFGTDGDFSRQMLHSRYNGELANGLGNLLSRTVNMIEKYFGGDVPPAGALAQQEQEILAAAADMHDSAQGVMDVCAFNVYLDKISALAAATNRYIDVTAPFKLAKDPAARDRLATILYVCAEAVRIILLYLEPVMPQTAVRGLAQLGWVQPPDGTLAELGRWGLLAPQTKTCKGEGLFPRKE